MKSAVEPMDVDKESTKVSKELVKSGAEVDSLTFEDIREQCRLIERGESLKETRQINRVLRSLVTIRRKINNNVLWRLINYYFIGTSAAELKKDLMAFLKSPTPIDDTNKASTAPKSPRQQKKLPITSTTSALLPEVETYLHLLLVLYLMSENDYQKAEQCIELLLKRLETRNRRSLDPLAAKTYYFNAVIAEKLGKLSTCIEYFQNRLRVATLRYDEDSMAVLINCLLRAYINDNAYNMAAHLSQRVSFPQSAGANAWARFHYYTGRILAIQLQYTEAKLNLQLALRKAPQHSAVGFRQAIQKLLVTVELLTGRIPERSIFRQAMYRKSLIPYYQLTRAVRSGNLPMFDEALVTYHQQLVKDGTLSMAGRLRQKVVKAAIRQMSVAYSCISMADIQRKLQLSCPDEARYIVAKAIKEDLNETELDENQQGDGCMKSKKQGELYGTELPSIDFNRRIDFCLGIYNQAVKAMRFPPKSYVKEIESIDEKREREHQELELAKEMADEDDGDFS